MKRLLRTLLVALVSSTAWAAASVRTEIPVGAGGRLVFTHPSDWQATVSGLSEGPTLRLTPRKNATFRILITAIPRLGRRPPNDKALRDSVQQQGLALLPTAMQTEITLLTVSGQEATGYLYHLTDREAERGPEDYREMHQGAVVVGPYVLSVTVLTHSTDRTTLPDALRTLAGASYVQATRP